MATTQVIGKTGSHARRAAGAALRGTPSPRVGTLAKTSLDAAQLDKRLFEMRVDKLRDEIRNQQVSFPAQIPTFSKHTRPDLQRKLVQLYFVCGWSAPEIRARYGLGEQRFQQILGTWKNRAIELGYIQAIPPDPRRGMKSMNRPIRVVMAPVANVPSEIYSTKAAQVENGHRKNADATGREKSCRPRRKCDSSRIARLLEDLRAGRAVADVADEVGVSVSTVRVWKKEREMQSLRRENRELRELLMKMSAIAKDGRLH